MPELDEAQAMYYNLLIDNGLRTRPQTRPNAARPEGVSLFLYIRDKVWGFYA